MSWSGESAPRDSLSTELLVQALKSVPEVRLSIIDLAREAFKDVGEKDIEWLGFHAKELKEAVSETQAYVEATREAVRCLRNMARS
jgi:hypothetical protein